MPNLYTKLTENSERSGAHWHLDSNHMIGNEYVPRMNNHLVEANARNSDTYPVDHGLSKQDERILHKILARDYHTDTGVGRKRGAILRYIKHFRDTQHTPPKVNGKTLYKYLKRNG